MSVKQRRTARDARRRTHGQNFLVDGREIKRLIGAIHIEADQLVVEVGPGRGALTIALAHKGARVIAVEADSVWAGQLQDRVDETGLADRVKVVLGDFRSFQLPKPDFRVVSSPPFGLTTRLFEFLFDRPTSGPWRADLLIQSEVAVKRAANPPRTLRSAAWAPWWAFELGPTVPARAFRPVPPVDATVLTARRREPGLMPGWLAPQLRELLRPGWHSSYRLKDFQRLGVTRSRSAHRRQLPSEKWAKELASQTAGPANPCLPHLDKPVEIDALS